MNVDTPEAPPLDLSKATKLKGVVFNYPRSDIQWITTAIKTIKSKNLQQIAIFSYTRSPLSAQIKEAVHQEWQELDHLLVQLWTSYSVRLKIMYRREEGEDKARGLAQRLLPELTRRGIIEVAGCG